MAVVSGKRGRITVDGQAINCHDVDVDDNAVDVDGQTFLDEGFDSGDIGPEGLSGNGSGYWTSGGGSPPGVFPRSDAPITVTPMGGASYSMGEARILSAKCTVASKGAIGFALSFKSNGQFTRA